LLTALWDEHTLNTDVRPGAGVRLPTSPAAVAASEAVAAPVDVPATAPAISTVDVPVKSPAPVINPHVLTSTVSLGPVNTAPEANLVTNHLRILEAAPEPGKKRHASKTSSRGQAEGTAEDARRQEKRVGKDLEQKK